MPQFYKRLLKGIAIFIVVICVIALFAAQFVLPYAIIERQKWDPELLKSTNEFKVEHLEFVTTDSLVMRGSLISPQKNDKNKIVICLHGIGANRSQFYPAILNLTRNGYSTLVIDLRGHGLSDGQYTTYGYHEKDDVRVVVDSLKARYPNKSTGIWGYSLGGEVALQSLAQDARLEFGIIESTFSSMEQVVYDYQARFTADISLPILCDIALNSADDIAGFNHEHVVPLESAQEITQPIFMAHGTDDKRIPIRYGKQIFQNLKSQKKQFTAVEGATHVNVRTAGGEQYYRNLVEFLEEI